MRTQKTESTETKSKSDNNQINTMEIATIIDRSLLGLLFAVMGSNEFKLMADKRESRLGRLDATT